MFKYQEDEFLRRGGDYSRNCLSVEEEEEEAGKVHDSNLLSWKRPVDIGSVVTVSAGGKATEALVKTLYTGSNLIWQEHEFGKYGRFARSLANNKSNQRVSD